MTEPALSPFQMVIRRLYRAAGALDAHSVPHAVIGGMAVFSWVLKTDEDAVRMTPNVDLLLWRSDLDRATTALAEAGFRRWEREGRVAFLDGHDGRPSTGVRLIFAGERFRPDYLLPAPDVAESVRQHDLRVITLDALVRMKLTAYRSSDRMHLIDLYGVGLLSEKTFPTMPTELHERLRAVLAEAASPLEWRPRFDLSQPDPAEETGS